MKFNPSILSYLGKLDIGILVLISITYQDKYYESTFFYTTDKMVLTISRELEEEIGHKIQDDEDYPNLLRQILKKIVPYNQMINNIDDVDFSRWVFK